ncbi:hypothetical protein MFLAVUS_011494 [Mucor flavus]|uniref:Uncharacterized protein n=1 Tax=Mucor flavus TaxID=439312 RepID=A0ABP9ZFL8_9FUNG
MVLFAKDLEKAIATNTVEDAIKRCSELLIRSIVRSQDRNWVFITQTETYYYQKEIDDVAQVRRKIVFQILKSEKKEKALGAMHIYFLTEDGKGVITTEDGVEAMDYIVDEGNEFNLKNLTNLSKYKELNPTPIEL